MPGENIHTLLNFSNNFKGSSYQSRFLQIMETKLTINLFTSPNILCSTIWLKILVKTLWWECKEVLKETNKSVWSTWNKKLKKKFTLITTSISIKFNGNYPWKNNLGLKRSLSLLNLETKWEAMRENVHFWSAFSWFSSF